MGQLKQCHRLRLDLLALPYWDNDRLAALDIDNKLTWPFQTQLDLARTPTFEILKTSAQTSPKVTT